jgi:hypothetical protein
MPTLVEIETAAIAMADREGYSFTDLSDDRRQIWLLRANAGLDARRTGAQARRF